MSFENAWRAAVQSIGADNPAVFLTGAGVSAESGIPTFRGPEGYWRVGSRNYHPMELATHAAFSELPEEVWRWYLYRRAVCRAAAPNPAHLALVAAEDRLGDGFLLVTQNVDGLHLRAGNQRVYQIHGNIDFCRCAGACADPPRPLPAAIGETWAKEQPFGAHERQLLTCTCGAWLRPHVLWFDESYDEPLFRYSSTVRAIERAALLVVVGTSGATTLPARMCERAAARGIPIAVIDELPTPFTALAQGSRAGAVMQGKAGTELPALVTALLAAH